MIKIGPDVEIERYECGWKLRRWTVRKKTPKNPSGRTSKTTYHATLEQACMAVVDADMPDSVNAQVIVDAMTQTRQAIVEALKERDT
jgi:hypothetical protein